MNQSQLDEHTLKSYDRKLGELVRLIQEMGDQVKEIIRIANRSLSERNAELAVQAKAMDKQINALDRQIEEQATITLALQNPMAVDLRFVTSTLKISVALERAGDLAKNIAKRSAVLGDYMPKEALAKISDMVDVVCEMLDGALSALRARDMASATAVWKQDDRVDALYVEIFSILQKDMQRDPSLVEACTQLIFAAKNFERIADYATNIAKTVHYISTGEQANKRKVLGPKDGGSGV